jgi:hypothetical protein
MNKAAHARSDLDESHLVSFVSSQLFHMLIHPQEGVAEVVNHNHGMSMLQKYEHRMAPCDTVPAVSGTWDDDPCRDMEALEDKRRRCQQQMHTTTLTDEAEASCHKYMRHCCTFDTSYIA